MNEKEDVHDQLTSSLSCSSSHMPVLTLTLLLRHRLPAPLRKEQLAVTLAYLPLFVFCDFVSQVEMEKGKQSRGRLLSCCFAYSGSYCRPTCFARTLLLHATSITLKSVPVPVTGQPGGSRFNLQAVAAGWRDGMMLKCLLESRHSV